MKVTISYHPISCIHVTIYSFLQVFTLLVIAAALGCGTSAPLIDYCKFCINFAGQFINQLLNIILSKSKSFKFYLNKFDSSFSCTDVGVVGGCADLCEMLANKTNSEAAEVACNILCDLVGIKEFINIINKYDNVLGTP